MPSTAPAREGLFTPEPWVPVWTAPATEMWGSDARLWMATPDCSKRAAQRTVTHSAADADRLPFPVQFDVLRQGVQQHVDAVGVPHAVEGVPRSQGLDPSGARYQFGEFGHRLWPPDVR